ncbi:YhbY family RNA-binding protein [bacterium]|nr:YhbY family RNA-binding protein [bacterium]
MKTSLKQAFKAQAHHLKPVVLLGNKGLTPAVIEETNVALTAHELIKIKINGAEKAERLLMATELCQQLQAELVQLIGHIAIIYRKNNTDMI